MLTKDGRTLQQILAAIDWTFDDEFWRTNIRSASKLREKWGQLRGAAERKQSQARQGPKLTRSEEIYMAEMRRINEQEATQPRLEVTA